MIQAENLSFGFPEKDLYKKVSFSLEAGDHCAFIGSNGTGKTTLADMLIHPDNYLFEGKIIKDDLCRIGYVNQFFTHQDEETDTVFDFLSKRFVENQHKTAEICEEMATAEEIEPLFEVYQKLLDEYEAMDGDNYESNIRKALYVAGMRDLETRPLHLLSGGEYKLLQVMREMLTQPNLLIMDEPDAFLDFENLNRLCALINHHKGTLLVITHNRYLLNHCFNKILHLENADIQEFDGTYSDYRASILRQKLELKLQANKEQEEIERTEKMVANMRAKATAIANASLGRQVHAKQTQLDRLRSRKIKEPFIEIREPEIVLPNVEPEAEKTVLTLENYQLRFQETLLEEVNFSLLAGEKVAVVGANGTGKTTLIRDIMSQNNDSIWIDQDAKPMFLSQFQDKSLDQTLSGGEQRLEQLSKIGNSDSELLILDEPSSHLDIYAQHALEKALSEYKGAVFMVSHDFYLINACADYVLLVEDKGIRKMRNRTFRKMVYEKYFDQKYLEIDQKKQELETRISKSFQNNDLATVEKLCEQLEALS